MAADTIVTGSKLTAVADAIRAKTGGSAALTLDQMPGEIGSIRGGTLSSLGRAVLTRQYAGSFTSFALSASDFGASDGSNVYLRDYAFADVGGGSNCKCNVRSVEVPRWIEHIGRYAFNGCLIEDITFQGDTTDPRLVPEMYAFSGISPSRFVCNRLLVPVQYMVGGTNLQYLELTAAVKRTSESRVYFDTSTFQNMTSLQTVVFHHRSQYNGVSNGSNIQFNGDAFTSYTKNVTKVVLDTDALVPVYSATVAFPFRNFTAATVYVTDSLLADYQNDANWTASLAAWPNVTLDAMSNYVAPSA